MATITDRCYRCGQPPGAHFNGYCPPPMTKRSIRWPWITGAIISGVFMLLALFVTLRASAYVNTCSSGLGVLGQAFNHNAAYECNLMSLTHTISELFVVVSVITGGFFTFMAVRS